MLKPGGSPSVTAIIATLDEAPSVAEVIRGTLKHIEDVAVVDGGSEDGTCEIAVENGARVVHFPQKGKGRALQHSIATENAHILLFIDADGSHDPNDIPRLLEPLLRDEADLVIGSRITGGSDELEHPGHFIRALGSSIIGKTINLRFGASLTDVQNGFRAIRTAVARDLDLREPRFCIEQEMAMQCLRRGYRVVNVPAHEYARKHGDSRIRVWVEWPKYVWNCLSLVLRPSVRTSGRPDRNSGVEN
jgi:glycosyltransferase involved in cell wall biosynthesis